jgi:hypothetical protein
MQERFQLFLQFVLHFLHLILYPQLFLLFLFQIHPGLNNGFNAPSAIISKTVGKNLEIEEAKAPPALMLRDAPIKSIFSTKTS